MLEREYSGVVVPFLTARGYVEGQSGAGTFRVVGRDGAPGWSAWMVWVAIEEDPGRPPVLEDLTAALRAPAT